MTRMGYATSESKLQFVKIAVPEILSIETNSAFTLTMQDFVAGSSSDTYTSLYIFKSNNNRAADGATVVYAHLNNAFDDIQLFANVGVYVKQGGNASLMEVTAGEVEILTTATDLAKKVIDSGNGKILRGQMPITYRATAATDLQSGNQSRTLTVTFSDT
jgi:hypothetical protein